MKRNAKNLLAVFISAFVIALNSCSDDETIVADNHRSTASTVDDTRDAGSARKSTSKYLPANIQGTINGIAFTGQPRITKFENRDNQLYATGTLANVSGTGLPAAASALNGQQVVVPATVLNQTSAAAAAAAGSCDILFLQLGPLDLDLLGLQVHLDQVTLDINAQSGSGNLLGNLLCAITGLLDGVGTLTQIAQLLNQIISLIGTLP